MADRVTRASNATAHPGMVDRNPTRRSKEEVQAEKDARALAKAQAASERKANIERLAALEKAERQRAKNMDWGADDPPAPPSQAKARVSRKRPVDAENGQAETPTKRKKGASAFSTAERNKGLADERPAASPNILGASGSEGEQADDDAELRIKRNEKKGLVAREQVSAAVAAMSDDPGPSPFVSPFVPGLGWVGTQAPHPGSQSNRSMTPFGLRPTWQNTRSSQTPAPTPSRRNTSPDSDRGSDTTLSTRLIYDTFDTAPSQEATTEPDDAPVYNYGGFVSENSGSGLGQFKQGEDPDSEVNTPSQKVASGTLKYKSITKIREIHTTPRYAAKSNTSKKNFTYDDLPDGTKDLFKKKILPLSLDTTGALKPWSTPDDKAIIDLWNFVYDSELPEHRIKDGDIDCKPFLVARTLIKRAISAWLHKFAETAEKALDAEYAQQGLVTKEERSSFVARLLGDANDMSAKNRPFLWETVYDNPSAKKEGLYQGRLVGRTFMEHLQIINNIDPKERVQEPPVGALILAVQAVHRALLYSVTGTFLGPSDKRASEFSKTNWDDRSFKNPQGERTFFKRASVFLKSIKALKEEQWIDIFEVAMSFQTKRSSKSANESDEEISETDSDEYDELVDPRYNPKSDEVVV